MKLEPGIEKWYIRYHNFFLNYLRLMGIAQCQFKYKEPRKNRNIVSLTFGNKK